MKMLQGKEMAVSGADISCLCFQGTAKKLVVVWIFYDPVGFVLILGQDKGFFPDQFQDPDYLFRLESQMFLNMRLLQRLSDLFENFLGNNQFKRTGNPELLQLGNRTV